LLVGDHLLVNKFVFGGRDAWYDKYLPYRSLQRGDIIVFKFPYQDHPHFVKRVIGLPGDHLKVVDQQVYVNGKPLSEPYVVHDAASGYDPLNYSFPPVGNQLFVSLVQPEWAHEIHKYIQGDELVAIMGRPFLIYWSIEANSSDYGEASFGQRIVGIFDTLLHLPARTRWGRMLHTVH
jgi:signal peptidase I